MKLPLLILGFICLSLAVLGIFLPVLPTTPLLLLAAFLFSKSSHRWHEWLLQHPGLGPYIHDYQANKCIPRKVKCITLSLLWLSMSISIYLTRSMLWLPILLAVIAIAVSIHILSFKSK